MNKLFFLILAALVSHNVYSQATIGCDGPEVTMFGLINGSEYISGSTISSSCVDVQVGGSVCWDGSPQGNYYADLFANGSLVERQGIYCGTGPTPFTFTVMPSSADITYTTQVRKLDETLVANSDNFIVTGINSYSTNTRFVIDNNAVVVDLDHDGPDDLVAIANSGGYCHIVGWKGTDFGYSYEGVLWSTPTSSYSSSNVLGRIAAGDFDHDGKMDDIAILYNLGTNASAIHVATWNGSVYNTPQTWLSQSSLGGYESSLVTGRFVSGDFDADGYIDDIAMMYDYGLVSGSYKSRIHVYQSNGSTFSSGANATWLTESTLGYYDASKVKYRFVSGDFDGDARQDDIAMMYDYGLVSGNYKSRIHVYTGNGSMFSAGTAFVAPSGGATWITESSMGSYNAANVARRFVSGDFDGDLDYDDIAVMYDYSGTAAIHVFIGNSTSFAQQTWFSASSFGSVSCALVGGNFFSVRQNFEYSKSSNEIVLIYPYSMGVSGYDNSNLWGFVGAPISNEGYNLATSFNGVVMNYLYCNGARSMPADNGTTLLENNSPFIVAYPNPVHDVLTIQSELEEYRLEVYSIDGKMIASYNNPLNISVAEFTRGTYVLKFFTGIDVYTQSIVKN